MWKILKRGKYVENLGFFKIQSSSLLHPSITPHPHYVKNEMSFYNFFGVTWLVNKEKIKDMFEVFQWTIDINSLNHRMFVKHLCAQMMSKLGDLGLVGFLSSSRLIRL
ncbi:hypothetical protein KFK09_023577 [Dendrobium nobile]|uniref:Uncharacterized protein n=1 Tax=Dendrobium nobile TaxID=94219 RepID=A0A8T3ABB7_DENNO|nr:hypothetical protein KFK09_023577 [Dendrobium nobile]